MHALDALRTIERHVREISDTSPTIYYCSHSWEQKC